METFKQNIGKAIVQMQGVLDARQKTLDDREKALDEKEESFQKRCRLFEESHPKSGKETDFLQLNIGGSSRITVLRSTLTHYEGSGLASLFCGRCDDSIPKDKEGNFLLDHDPEVFLKLINFLRMVDKTKRTDVSVPTPKPTAELGWLLEYYGLTFHVYPQGWWNISNHASQQNLWNFSNQNGIGVVAKSSSLNEPTILRNDTINSTSFVLDLDPRKERKPAICASMTIVFKAGVNGSIQWYRQDHQQDPFVRNRRHGDLYQQIRCVDQMRVSQSEADQVVKMKCTYNSVKSVYVYKIDAHGQTSSTLEVKLTEVQPTPCIMVSSGTVWILDMSYLFD